MVATPLIEHNLRCQHCGRLLAELTAIPYRLRCPRCKKVTERLG